MASGKKGRRSGTSRSGSGSSRNKKKGSSAAASGLGGGLWQGLTQAFVLTFFGRVMLALVGMAILVGINLLVSRDRFDVFYVFCAVEVIAFVAIGWLKLLLKPDSE